MHALRSLAVVLLAAVAIVAATGAVLWSASLAGLARVETVASSAMAPDLVEDDLVVLTRRPVAELRAGDVVLVGGAGASAGFARVVATEPVGADRWRVSTAAAGAVGEHALGDEAWAPSVRVPVAGSIAAAMLEPRYGVPAVALVLLLGAVVLLARSPVVPRRRATAARRGR